MLPYYFPKLPIYYNEYLNKTFGLTASCQLHKIIMKTDKAHWNFETGHLRKSVIALAWKNRPVRIKGRKKKKSWCLKAKSQKGKRQGAWGQDSNLPRIRGNSCTMWRMRRSRHLDRYALPLCCSLPGVVFLLSLSMYITSLHTAKCKRLPLMIKQLIASVQKMPPRQMFPGGTVPIMLTFRFVTTCQAQSICALEKSKCSCREKIRQLWISPPVCYNNALTSFASAREKKPHSSHEKWKANNSIQREGGFGVSKTQVQPQVVCTFAGRSS